jgi:hypothetical protein
MKRSLGVAAVLLVGAALGSVLGLFVGRALEREANSNDQAITSFAPIEVGLDQSSATTAGESLNSLIPWSNLGAPLIIATDGSQGSNSELWRWNPNDPAPIRIPTELPADAWWYDQRTGYVVGTLSDPDTRTFSIIAGPVDGPFELVAEGVARVFPSLDLLPNGRNNRNNDTLFGAPLGERLYARTEGSGLFLWSADYTGPDPYASAELGPYDFDVLVGSLPDGEDFVSVKAGAFPGGTYFAMDHYEATSVVSFIDRQPQEASIPAHFQYATDAGRMIPPHSLILDGVTGLDEEPRILLLDLTTLEAVAFPTPESLTRLEALGCDVISFGSNYGTCLDPETNRSYTTSLLDESLAVPGLLVGHSRSEGLSFARVLADTLGGFHTLVILNEMNTESVWISQFENAIYGVWSEK